MNLDSSFVADFQGFTPFLTPFIQQALEGGDKHLNPRYKPVIYNLLKKRQHFLNARLAPNEVLRERFANLDLLIDTQSKKAYKEACSMESFILTQMSKDDSIISDYEISFNVCLWNETKYAQVEELSGNPFFEFSPSLYFPKKNNSGNDDILNHPVFNKKRNTTNVPFLPEQQSPIFHDLVEHTYLAWQDLLDAEEVEITMKIEVQSFNKVIKE